MSTDREQDKRDNEKFVRFMQDSLLPQYKREDYFRSISTPKLIKAAVRVLWPHIRLYTAQEAIFEEMVTRLEATSRRK